MTCTPGAVVTLGETMGLFYSETPGSLLHATHLKLGIGGAESNVAIGLARLGTPATWIGRVGDDSLGQRIIRELRAEDVCVRVAVDADAPTGLMVKERRTPESIHVRYYRSGSAGSRLTAADIPEDDIAAAAMLHVTGITPALSASAHDAVLTATRIAHDAGVPISFDVNHRVSLWPDHGEVPVYRRLAELSTVVFAGVSEARLLVPDAETPSDLARGLADAGPSQVIIKLGAEGCYARIDGVDYVQSAVPITVVDSVGAGDAFVAGYLSELVAGADPSDRLRTAVMTGAFACLTSGDWEGLPDRRDLARFAADDPVSR